MSFTTSGVVQLRSGSPAVTIEKATNGKVTVWWYADGEFKTADIPPAVLQGEYKPVDAPKKDKVKDKTLGSVEKKGLS
jgi:uncharacterized protein YodC (DUF2158 family)